MAADRILVWHVPTPIEVGTGVREVYELDNDYRPVRVWMHLDGAPTLANLVIDIIQQDTPTASAVTIFTSPSRPRFPATPDRAGVKSDMRNSAVRVGGLALLLPAL